MNRNGIKKTTKTFLICRNIITLVFNLELEIINFNGFFCFLVVIGSGISNIFIAFLENLFQRSLLVILGLVDHPPSRREANRPYLFRQRYGQAADRR